MLKHLFLLLVIIPLSVSGQKHHFKEDFIDDDKYYYTFEDDVPPVDTRDSYLSSLIFLYHTEGLNDRTRAKLCKELGYVYYMKHQHESADYYFFRAKEYYQFPSIKANPKVQEHKDEYISKDKPKKEQQFLERLFTLKYNNLSQDQIKKLSKEVDKEIEKLSHEKDSMILSDQPNLVDIKEKDKSIKILKGTQEHLKTVLQNFKLKFEKGQLKKYLIWALVGLLLLILIIILIIWNVRQKLKIQKQDGEIEQQLIDISTKNTYLEHAAKIIRHDMHSGINTYIPRGLTSLERRLSEDDIKNLKLEAPLKLIKDGVNHAQKVYKNVYAFTNLVKKDVILEKTSCDLKEILDNHLQNTSYKSQVSVNDLVTAEVDEILFCTTIDNLVRNGLKYNDSESKLVQIYMENSYTIVIEDNGRGMTSKQFEKYLKPHESEGLGLNICIAILKEHSFTVSCEKIETGTKIRVFLNSKEQ